MADTWIRCQKCRCEIGIPENPSGTIRCPKCSEVVFSIDEKTGIKWRPPAAAPDWMRPAGYVCTIIGVLGFIASFGVALQRAPSPDLLAATLSGILNPLFFVGLPLGIYWLRRCGDLARLMILFWWLSPADPTTQGQEIKRLKIAKKLAMVRGEYKAVAVLEKRIKEAEKPPKLTCPRCQGDAWPPGRRYCPKCKKHFPLDTPPAPPQDKA